MCNSCQWFRGISAGFGRIKTVFFYGIIILLVVQLGCRARPSCELMETDRFQIEFIDPLAPDDMKLTGDRFLRGGWIRSLRHRENGAELLLSESYHRRLPNFGFPFEFYPTLELEASESQSGPDRLQIGVGIVREKGEGRFETVPVEFFRWRSRVEKDGEQYRWVCSQSSGIQSEFGYELTVKVALERGSDIVGFEIELVNVGERVLQTELIGHPFFAVGKDCSAGKYWLPGDVVPLSIAESPHSRTSECSGNTLGAMGFSPDFDRVELRTEPPMSRGTFWRSKTGCFSLEPCWEVRLAPSERKSWKCFLKVLPKN